MLMPGQKKVRVWNRGQITIPKGFRTDLEISDDTILNMVRLGNSIIITPKSLKFPRLAKEFQAIMKEENISEEDLLTALKEARREIFKEKYGKKS
jgi:AbrB family looped-hinge helix DNA binding protein